MSSHSGTTLAITTIAQATHCFIGRHNLMQMPIISHNKHIDALQTSFLLSAFPSFQCVFGL